MKQHLRNALLNSNGITKPLLSMKVMDAWSAKDIGSEFDTSEMRKLLIHATLQQAYHDGVTALEIGEKEQGYKMTLISTQVDEGAQHLYRKLGYIDCGGLLFDHTPMDQPMEMFFRKVL